MLRLITTCSILFVLAPASANPQAPDPSLIVAPAVADATPSDLLPSVVLRQDDVLLTWDGVEGTFSLELGGELIADLVTGVDDRGWPSFSGAWTDSGAARVYGSVLVRGSGDEYFVELTRPNWKPRLYSVAADGTGGRGSTPKKECDCSDRITLDCDTQKCRDKDPCGESYHCDWFVVVP